MSIRRPVGSPTKHDDDSTSGAVRAGVASRRQFVQKIGLGTAAAAGAVAIPGAVFATAAGAQSSTEEIELTPADTSIVLALEALETAAVEIYASALEITSLLPASQQLFAHYQRHHTSHVEALVAARGGKDTDDPTPANETVQAQVTAEIEAARSDDDLAAQERGIYQALYALESNLAATFLVATGLIEETTVTAVVVGVGPVDGQQAFYLGTSLGLPTDEILPPTQPVTGAYPLPSA